MSENIRVRSILGRYLEHSRIIRFGHGDEGEPAVPHRLAPTGCRATSIAGSRCWCRSSTRSTRPGSSRCSRLQLADDVVRWEMDGDGSWQRRGPEQFTDGDAQEHFYQWVADRQRR